MREPACRHTARCMYAAIHAQALFCEVQGCCHDAICPRQGGRWRCDAAVRSPDRTDARFVYQAAVVTTFRLDAVGLPPESSRKRWRGKGRERTGARERP